VSQSPLAPIARPTLTDQIVERITAFILDASMRPGDKLPSERELMVRLGVGRSSLREAIKTLSAIGIVDVQIGDGMYVGSGQTAVLTKPLSWGLLIGEHNIREVIEARRTVETELCALAASRATDEELATISGHYQAMRASGDDAEAFTEADQQFHLAIAAAARNGVLYHVLDMLRHVVRVWIFKTFSEFPDRVAGFDEHAAIEAALRARDPDAARQAMAAHVDGAGNRLLALLVGEPGATPDLASNKAG
jgi:GntR family transcriptional regulator, transcriptional repressor for pyruvate dehydrogenase complex